jgi:hypothetical protein
MALVLKDRVLETSQTSGTGTLTLAGAVIDFQSFSSAIGNGNTTYYTIADDADNQWEVGIGTVGASTLTRDTVLSSSNSGAKVNFGASIKNVFCDYPATKSVYLDASDVVTVPSLTATTIVKTPIVQAVNSGGLALKNSAGTTQMSVGAGGGDNMSINVSTNLNGTNAQIDISPTGTGHVHIKPTGVNSVEIAPTFVGDMDNIIIGATTPVNGTFTNLRLNTTLSVAGSTGTAGYILTSGGSSATPTWTNPTSIVGGAGGSNTQVQYNNSGVLAGSANMTFNGTTFTTANDASISGLTVGKGAGAVASNTVLGASAFGSNVSGANNVAVGQQALRVNTASNNTAIGYQAGYSNTTGSQITAIGYQAGLVNTTGIRLTAVGIQAGNSSTGSFNTYVGSYAGYLNSSGEGNAVFGDGSFVAIGASSYNSVFGAASMQANTTGANNTAVGYQSLKSNTTASNNTAVGYQAGYSNTTGRVVAIGYQALYANTTAVENTAVGALALTATTTGNSNDAFGNNTARTNTTGTANSAFGSSALEYNTTGAYNVAVGRLALNLNTTASSNTAVGYQAGYSNTTGTLNAFFGNQSGYANTTGSNNTFVGIGITSNSAATTGSNNVSLGSNSFFNATSASDIVACGANALQTNTTGSSNTAIGRQALFSNTTASNNTAVGYQAGYSNTTGSVNVAIGSAALQANTTGAANIGIGYQAGYGTTTGGPNTFIGYQAGLTNIVGSNNTFVGQNSGQLNTGSNNTFFGAGAGYAMTTGGKNTIVGFYTGNQSGLDIRTASNYIVLSDGDGLPIIASAASKTVALQGALPNAGTGITFPATQSASSDANTLDDYEEGTWTPTIKGSTTSGTGTYTLQIGSYVKIGSIVTVQANILITNHTGTGNILLSGLPFNAFSTTNNWGTINIGYVSDLALTALNYLTGMIAWSSSDVTLFQTPVGGGTATQVPMDTSFSIVYTATYRTT